MILKEDVSGNTVYSHGIVFMVFIPITMWSLVSLSLPSAFPEENWSIFLLCSLYIPQLDMALQPLESLVSAFLFPAAGTAVRSHVS